MRMSEHRKYLYFIIYFIVQYHTHTTMKNANWNWYASKHPFHPTFTSQAEWSKKSLHKLSPISQTLKPQMSEFRNDTRYLSNIFRANSSKLNEFVFVFLLQNGICRKCHDTENKLLLYAIIEINDTLRFRGCLQYIWDQKIWNLVLVL